jgi:hypothetical protein
VRKSTSKNEFLRRLEHRRHRLDGRFLLMREGRREKRLGARIARLEIRIDKVREEKL